jgi:hypothetical protein
MQHVAACDPASAESPRVGVVAYFENSAVDVCGVPGKEAFDIVAIDGIARTVPVVGAERCRPTKITKIDFADLRHRSGPIIERS